MIHNNKPQSDTKDKWPLLRPNIYQINKPLNFIVQSSFNNESLIKNKRLPFVLSAKQSRSPFDNNAQQDKRRACMFVVFGTFYAVNLLRQKIKPYILPLVLLPICKPPGIFIYLAICLLKSYTIIRHRFIILL